jgi:hypothetical protein
MVRWAAWCGESNGADSGVVWQAGIIAIHVRRTSLLVSLSLKHCDADRKVGANASGREGKAE